MKIIGKMTGLRLLEEITNNNISCKTMIRCKNESISDVMEIPIYDYYIFTKGDGRFHRCDENGKLGAKGQKRFMNYGTLTKEFEILEEAEDKEYDDIDYADNLEQGEYIDYANDYEVKFDIVKNRRLINALIRNQKYILERLDKNE